MEKLFEPMFEGDEEYKTLIAEAEKRLAVMDNCDGGPVLNEEWMLTILTALSGGMYRKDMSMIADAYLMLRELERQMRR